jgi:hypothetical protein
VFVTANHVDDALKLYDSGADYVILPHFLGGNYISTMIENYEFNIESFLEEKIRHLSYLKIESKLK